MNRVLCAALDLVAIGAFATIGRASHAELGGALGIAETAWPFAAGWAVGVLVTRYWRRADSLRTGVGVWAATVAGGMLLRAATGSGVQPAFVVVTAVTLAVLLLGWRAVHTLLTRRTVPRPASATRP